MRQADRKSFYGNRFGDDLSLNAAHADPITVVSSGLPTQIQPTYQEPGVPAFRFPPQTLGASFDPSNYAGPNVGNGISAAPGGGGAHNGGSALMPPHDGLPDLVFTAS